MMSSSAPKVSVIITAHDAASTIADAVTTALAEPETAEVIVVDDASTDDTGGVARTAAAGDPRLIVIACPQNVGPAAARNLAIDRASADFVAVLDADDFILPGRFSRLFSLQPFDMAADNILFIAESGSPSDLPPMPDVKAQVIDVDLAGFVRGNRSVRGSARQEWGFLKPVIRRTYLADHNLRYDKTLRLGEDYDLYVRMLQDGARFRVTTAVGYAARWRDGSLSSRHRTADLRALYHAAESHLSRHGTSPDARKALNSHRDDLRRRFLLRDFLDHRNQSGRLNAVLHAFARPATVLPIAKGVLLDKLHARRPAAPSRIGRLLL